MTFLSPQWVQNFYQFESTEELNMKLVFSESAAEKHMLELEIKRRKDEPNGQTSELPRSG